jgi:AraC-like DNA-binding protein
VAATVWIEDRFPSSSESSGPLVMTSRWMLEVVRRKDGRSFGLFLAPFGIVDFDIPELSGGNAEFVGYSRPGPPPARWLTASMVFALGSVPLPETPEELLALVAEARPYTSLEIGLHASSLAKKAKLRIAQTCHDGVSIADIARELGVSAEHLSRRFKRDFGFSPVRYRHHIRVQEAVERLSHGQKIRNLSPTNRL